MKNPKIESLRARISIILNNLNLDRSHIQRVLNQRSKQKLKKPPLSIN
jgi:hypothetical protein